MGPFQDLCSSWDDCLGYWNVMMNIHTWQETCLGRESSERRRNQMHVAKTRGSVFTGSHTSATVKLSPPLSSCHGRK